MKILCMIFSWKGQYENAKRLEEKLSPFVDTLVINSDDDNIPLKWINIGNECYFSDQFRKAIGVFEKMERYDVLWHIQADASYDKDWENIIVESQLAFEKYNWGVYAPNVDDTFYIPERTDVFNLENNLKVVATTDNTCWMIHRDIINDMIDNLALMDDNKLGWGWDLLICAFSHLRKRKVIRDYNFKINHPSSTGYMKEQAEQEMQDMFRKCDETLGQVIYDIKVQPIALNRIYDNPTEIKSSNVIEFDTEAVFR